MDLKCIEAADGNLVVQLRGEMDALGCTEVRPELEKIVDQVSQKSVLLDMEAVSFLDSSGIGVIVFLYKRLKAQGLGLEMINVHGQPLELMELLRIGSAIPIRTAGTLSGAAPCMG